MPTDTAFRLSTYLTLALSCLCIGYAEWDVLPEVGLFAAAAIISFIVIFRLEKRVELLSITAANQLGLMLGVANFTWGACRLIWELQHDDFRNTPWPLMFAAMFGLLLMSAMPAKLARREKHAGDYWWLHGMGLVLVCLSGAIAEDPLCFFFIVLYGASAAWSLSLFHLRQASGAILPIPGKPTSIAGGSVVSADDKQLGLRRAAGFIMVAGAVAVPLYLITPRSTAEKLTFGQPRVEIGYAADQMTDLNQTGELKANDSIAFEVTAEANGHPKTDLSPDQRWRGRRVLKQYTSGVWKNPPEFKLPGIEPGTIESPFWSPPNLGPSQCTLTFNVPARLRSEFFADPIVWAGGQTSPVATITPTGAFGWTWGRDGTFSDFRTRESQDSPKHYVQVWRPESDSDLSPRFRINDPDLPTAFKPLLYYPPKVKEYANQVLDEMISSGILPSNCRDPIHLLPRPEYHDRIARGFSAHLATTPTLTYTTHLRREVKKMDPVEEFLFHTRAGHCERFASALALMLRSQGIPTVLVLGFKGCEQTEEPGRYVVREEHAHAWVAALIYEFERSPDRDRRPLSCWRSLDPTPSSPAVAENTTGDGWTQPAVSWLRRHFRTYISEYTSEQRRRALAEVAEQAIRTENLIAVFGLVVGLFLLRTVLRYYRKPAIPKPSAQVEWFARLVARLGTCGFVPLPGETPLEYATRAANAFRKAPATVEVADVPLDWVETYYEGRFGDKSIPQERRDALDSRLDALIAAFSRGH